ncbi:MAG TPA: RluA family pseudouridine synthase [Candidatus Saccharimonadales bacterium]|nr:RluA family pseudouridine synthase [Candidatus Saccharimonadales bacterium]
MSNLNISRAKRLDQYVVEQYPRLSRAYAAKLIDDGSVLVNQQPSKPGYKLREGDAITITYDPAELARVPVIDLPVLYEDGDCVVINKPAGILTHSKGAFNAEATVATWLRSRLDGLSGERGGIVHRLDRATSGVMICAKTPAAMKQLQKQFSTRNAKKTYYAVIAGRLPHEHAVIDLPVQRNPKRPQAFRVDANGKSAQTEYWVREQNGRYELVELRPKTGRTHQLRVHLSELGHPIVGDPLYGGEPADRLYLHAEQLEITLPNRDRRTFTAPLPRAFRGMIEL